MKHLSYFLILTAIVSTGWRFEEISASSIVWSSTRPLLWSDFRGTPSLSSSADAASSIRITAKPYLKSGKIHYDVTAMFLPDDSWRRSVSYELLRHEQLHFDIAELYARKVRRKVAELQERRIRDVKVYQRAVAAILEESNHIDITYDTRTCHGAIADKQSQWERNINSELDRLKAYADPKNYAH